MRPVGYLENFASRLDEEPKTMVVIDRALAERGHRRKGQGRVIPAPTLREDLMLMLTVMVRKARGSGSGIQAAIEDAEKFATLPVMQMSGDFFNSLKSATFIEALEEFCTRLRQRDDDCLQAVGSHFVLELNLTKEEAHIDGSDASKNHVIFGCNASRVGRDLTRISRLRDGFLVMLAHTPRDD
ncbi:hypothetical protein [Marinibacterium profundimaris]|nr:hypothetical protein [Marinibacterium profundimaris]